MKSSLNNNSNSLYFFREDFVSGIAKTIIEQLRDKKSSIRFPQLTLSNEKENKIEKTLFDLLASQEGMTELRIKIAEILGSDKDKVLTYRFNEEELIFVLDQILSESLDSKCCQLIEIFDQTYQKNIGFNELFLIMIFISAYESGKTSRFLHIFGQILFKTVSGAHDQLHINILKSLIKLVVEKSLNEITLMLKKFDFKQSEEEIYFDDFELFLYYIFTEIDKNVKNVRLYSVDDYNLNVKFIEENQLEAP